MKTIAIFAAIASAAAATALVVQDSPQLRDWDELPGHGQYDPNDTDPDLVHTNSEQGFGPSSYSDLVPNDNAQLPQKDDTAFFVFNDATSTLGGSQTFGVANKVGVDADLMAQRPDDVDDFKAMGTAAVNAVRETYLQTNGHTLLNGMTWVTRVHEAKVIDGETRVQVIARLGSDQEDPNDRGSYLIAGSVYEFWKLEDGDAPTLVSRSLEYEDFPEE